MLEIRKEILKAAREAYADTYIEEAPVGKGYPYAIINFVGGEVVEEQEIYLMDIDVWTDDLSIQVDQISNSLWAKFRKFNIVTPNAQISVHRVNRFTIEDPDPVIRRRKLVFNLKYMNRELI